MTSQRPLSPTDRVHRCWHRWSRKFWSGSIWAIFIILCLVPRTSQAKVRRYAVLIGNNQGASHESSLRYAQSDALKVAAVLKDLGDVPRENVLTLLEEDLETVRRVLITYNERIRAETRPQDQSVLIVYYSGHADGDALHLGPDHFSVSQLRSLIRGSSATYRILVVDACRSGTLTRVKGGQMIPPFAIELDERLESEGFAFLTSSSANEDAQESDEIQGSFFTHHWVSGLRGAADQNRDDEVTVGEAYAYAYTRTLQVSSRTIFGPQHPTFEWGTRGTTDIVLTRMGARISHSSTLVFPNDRTYLVFRDDEHGAVLAEIDAHASHSRLVLPPGKYFIRGRAPTHLLEGTVTLEAGQERRINQGDLRRVDYARVARKGGTERKIAHGLVMGYQVRTPLVNDAHWCHGVRAGYPVDVQWFSVTPRLGWCRGTFDADNVGIRRDEFDVDVSFLRVFDPPIVSIGLGLSVGLAWLRQVFDTRGFAPPRNTLAGHIDAIVNLDWELSRGFYARTQISGQVYIFEQQRGNEPESSSTARFTARPWVGVGKRF